MNLNIDSRWKWAAMDADGKWSFYVVKPFIDHDEWAPMTSVEQAIPGRQYITVSSIVKGFPQLTNWRESLHRIVNNQLIRFELPKEPPAVIRAREILEECGIVDVQGTPADQLKPLTSLLEEISVKRMDHCKNDPDATLRISVDGENSVKFHKAMILTSAEFACYLVSK